MRLRKVENSSERFPVKDLLNVLLETLKDYIHLSQSEKDTILKDWESTENTWEEEPYAQGYLNLEIPVIMDKEIDFSLGDKIRCEVPEGFTVHDYIETYIGIKVLKNDYEIYMVLPYIKNLIDYFCEDNLNVEEGYPVEGIAGNIDQAKGVASKCKSYLDYYTSNLKIVFDSLKKMNIACESIMSIVNKE